MDPQEFSELFNRFAGGAAKKKPARKRKVTKRTTKRTTKRKTKRAAKTKSPRKSPRKSLKAMLKRFFVLRGGSDSAVDELTSKMSQADMQDMMGKLDILELKFSG